MESKPVFRIDALYRFEGTTYRILGTGKSTSPESGQIFDAIFFEKWCGPREWYSHELFDFAKKATEVKTNF